MGPAHLWLVSDLLADGRLRTILPGYSPPPVPLNLLIVPERANIRRVRFLVDFVAEQIGSVPGIEKPSGGAG